MNIVQLSIYLTSIPKKPPYEAVQSQYPYTWFLYYGQEWHVAQMVPNGTTIACWIDAREAFALGGYKGGKPEWFASETKIILIIDGEWVYTITDGGP
jgi:hypothetical protein